MIKYVLVFVIFIITLGNLVDDIKTASNKLKTTAQYEILQKWIQQPSKSGNEANIQKMIQDELISLGMNVTTYEMDIEEMKKNPNFITTRSNFKNSPNVIGILHGTKKIEIGHGGSQNQRKSRSLILNGHVDVVPEGDVEWTNDPFSGLIKDGKIYGRGSTDMKGGIFSSLIAIKIIKSLGIQLGGDVMFQSVIEEESGGSGTLSTVIKGFRADAAIIPEPTMMKIFPKQQGSMWFRIVVPGIGAHGGTRYEGVSAIEKSMIVIQKLLDLEKYRNDVFRKDPIYSQLEIPIPINVGKISGGKWPSSVADIVTLEGRFGISPWETIQQAKQTLTQSLLEIDDPFLKDHPVTLEFFGAHWLPGSVESSDPLLGELTRSYTEMTGSQPVLEGAPWGTDGGYLTNAGIPTIIFGPGETKLAHQTDEYIELEKIYSCAEIIAKTIIEWCK